MLPALSFNWTFSPTVVVELWGPADLPLSAPNFVQFLRSASAWLTVVLMSVRRILRVIWSHCNDRNRCEQCAAPLSDRGSAHLYAFTLRICSVLDDDFDAIALILLLNFWDVG